MSRGARSNMKMYLVAKGESASVRILKEGEVTDDPILYELDPEGFGAMSLLIEATPDSNRWSRILEMMLCDVLKQGLITGAALMCGSLNRQTALMREKVANDAIAAAAGNDNGKPDGMTN